MIRCYTNYATYFLKKLLPKNFKVPASYFWCFLFSEHVKNRKNSFTCFFDWGILLNNHIVSTPLRVQKGEKVYEKNFKSDVWLNGFFCPYVVRL